MTTIDTVYPDETAVVVATTNTTTPTRRVFQVGDKRFPDPGAEYSVDNVRRHLQTFLPELAHAKAEEKLLEDGTLLVTFTKQVTRKGAATPPAVDSLVAALTAVPPYEDPLVPLYADLEQERPLTLRALREQAQLLRDASDQMRDQTFMVKQVTGSCQRIQPIPLPCLPLHF